MLFGVSAVILLLSFIDTSRAVSNGEPTAACNNYIDTILRDLKDSKDYFEDPLKIQDKSIVLSKKLLFINYTGEATIKEGFIFGMSSLSRDGDVIVDKKRSIHLKVYLGAGELKMNGVGVVKLMGHGPTVQVEAIIKYINMKLDIVTDETGEEPKVFDFEIEDIKGSTFDVKGLGPLNMFLKAYINAMSTFFKGLIRTAIENAIKKFLTDKFTDYVVPQECLNPDSN